MKFGEVAIKQAEGAILAHSRRIGDTVLQKGRILTCDDIEAMHAADIDTITVARLESGDIGEDQAAGILAAALRGANLHTGDALKGRANLVATAPGVLTVDRADIDRMNSVHEGLTVATLPDYSAVTHDQMVATIKIIPFGLPEKLIRKAAAAAQSGSSLALHPFQAWSACLIMTEIDGLKDRIAEKTEAVIGRRLDHLGSRLAEVRRTAHDVPALVSELQRAGDAGHDLIMVFGASAIIDRNDVIPQAIQAAGGHVDHFGMPVDPGNLLAIGRIENAAVIGLPGCARSPTVNGFDWVLERLLARLPVTSSEIMGMGVGGLLKEAGSRPQRRRAPATPAGDGPKAAAIVLAAGRSRRMGEKDKRLEPLHGKPLLRHAVDAALASRANPVIIVIGPEDDDIETVLPRGRVLVARNPDPEAGIASSLATGISALPRTIDCVAICLGDMPRVQSDVIDALIRAYDVEEGRLICVPSFNGKRGNPVIWGRRFFPELKRLTGDEGARQLFADHDDVLTELAVDAPGILIDVDTEDALDRLRDDDK